MSVIRGKIFLDRKVVPSEITVGGDWPISVNSFGKKVWTETGKEVVTITLEELLELTDGGKPKEAKTED